MYVDVYLNVRIFIVFALLVCFRNCNMKAGLKQNLVAEKVRIKQVSFSFTISCCFDSCL